MNTNRRNKSSQRKMQGVWPVEKLPKNTKIVRDIKNKPFKEVTSMDLYLLICLKWTVEKIKSHYKVSLIKVLNRLRY